MTKESEDNSRLKIGEEKPARQNETDAPDSKLPLEIIEEERILDNIMVPVYFENDCEDARQALEEILRTVLGDPGLVVEKYHAEHVISNVGHHGVRIDVWARDGHGRQIALELQKESDEEIFPRALFEASTMIVHSLPKRAPYTQIDKVVVVFFADKDPGKKGDATYRFEFSNNGDTSLIKKYSPVCLFVNGRYRDPTKKLGRIIADIMEPDPAKMTIPILRERMDMLKNTEEGREKLKSSLQKYVEKHTDAELEKTRLELEKERREKEAAQEKAEKAEEKAEKAEEKAEKAEKKLEQLRHEANEREKNVLLALVKRGALSITSAAEFAGISPEALKESVDLHT